ncbi:MAG: hypothetical protein WDO70_01075 [Alphaproteobacteria bacterium]
MNCAGELDISLESFGGTRDVQVIIYPGQGATVGEMLLDGVEDTTPVSRTAFVRGRVVSYAGLMKMAGVELVSFLTRTGSEVHLNPAHVQNIATAKKNGNSMVTFTDGGRVEIYREPEFIRRLISPGQARGLNPNLN